MAQIPSSKELYWPIIVALRDLNGQATPAEMLAHMVANMNLPADYLDSKESKGKDLSLKMGWARSHLKIAGLVENPSRGRWVLTPAGVDASDEVQVQKLVGVALARHLRVIAQKKKSTLDTSAVSRGRPAPGRAGRPHKKSQPPIPQPKVSPALDVSGWQSKLLQTLAGLSHKQFERLCLRWLESGGFSVVSVSSSSAAGTVEGVGTVRIGLASFATCFFATRSNKLVQVEHIRSFRGGLLGRADKGIYVTTGAFSENASFEAGRAGTPTISLIDGKMLCDELMRYKMGVQKVEAGIPDEAFFGQL